MFYMEETSELFDPSIDQEESWSDLIDESDGTTHSDDSTQEDNTDASESDSVKLPCRSVSMRRRVCASVIPPGEEGGMQLTVDSLSTVFTILCSPQTRLKSLFDCITNELGVASEYILLAGESVYSIDNGQSTLEALGIQNDALLVLQLQFTIVLNGEKKTFTTEFCKLGRDLYFAILNTVENSSIQVTLNYEKGRTLPLDLTTKASLQDVLVYKGMRLLSIKVKSFPIITVTYRRCQFCLSPAEWKPFVTQNTVCLFKAVSQCIEASTPIVVVWRGANVPIEALIPIQDVLATPAVTVLDLFVTLPKSVTIRKIEIIEKDIGWGYPEDCCYYLQGIDSCSEEDITTLTSGARYVNTKTEKDPYDLVVNSSATLFLPPNLFRLYSEMHADKCSPRDKSSRRGPSSAGSPRVRSVPKGAVKIRGQKGGRSSAPRGNRSIRH